MAKYNFANLSPYDLELLSRDLLKVALDLNLRAFAPGQDKGVDLRAWQAGRRDKKIIVQCKHYQGSTYSQLKRAVQQEKRKLDKINPRPIRYLLVTTKQLTEANITELSDMLKPFCISEDDIIDGVALEEMLEQHDDVLRRHYKLWVTSTPVMQRILNAGVYNRSEEYLKELAARSRTFVQPRALSRARRILKSNHTCIISGQPGVGKTTLADMLSLEYLAAGFELIVVSEDILEADPVYQAQHQQLFVYDDFLGRNDLQEKLGKNEDGRIVQFIRRVGRSPNHRFILTTREYILRAAKIRYDRLDTGEIDPLKCVLEMNAYTDFQKGLILYQHLAFANNVSQADLQDLVRKKRYIEIVEHPNYTPRHIVDALEDIGRRNKKG